MASFAFTAISHHQMCLKALMAVHRADILHRDIKPENFLVSQKDGKLEVVLTDFGLSKKVKNAKSNGLRYRVRLNRKGNPTGTHGYRSPELYEEQGKFTVKSDVYALGVTLAYVFGGGELKAHRISRHIREMLCQYASEWAEFWRIIDPHNKVDFNIQAVLERMLESNVLRR